MKYVNIRLFIFLVLFPTVNVGQILVYTLVPYPGTRTLEARSAYAKSLQKGSNLPHFTLNRLYDTSLVSGIISTYAGFIDVSDMLGITEFPLKHSTQRVTLVITEHITPVTITANTVHHWQIERPEETVIYQFDRSKDTQTGLLLWQARKIELPENNQIPLDALIILAHPTAIYIPLGATLTPPSPNLVLPPLYVKEIIDTVNSGLYLLNIAHYFKNIEMLAKKGPTELSLRPVPN